MANPSLLASQSRQDIGQRNLDRPGGGGGGGGGGERMDGPEDVWWNVGEG